MSKIYKINLETEKNKFESIICGNAKIFLHFVNMIQTAIGEDELKTAKEAQEELNAHNIGWEEFDSKDCDKDIFTIQKQNAIKELDSNDGDYQTAVSLILNTFEQPKEDEVLTEPDAITEEAIQEDEINDSAPVTYCKCAKCGHEDFLRDGQTKCGSCGTAIPEVTKVCCKNSDCIAETFVTENIKKCPYCDTDLYSIEERLENIGVIPTDDPVKKQKIDSKRHAAMVEERERLLKDKSNKELISDSFNYESMKALRLEMEKLHIEQIQKIDYKEADKTLKALKSLYNLCDYIKEQKDQLENINISLRNLSNNIKNFQLELDLETPDESDHIFHDDMPETENSVPEEIIAEANKEAAETQEITETGNPATEETQDIQEATEEIVNPEVEQPEEEPETADLVA